VGEIEKLLAAAHGCRSPVIAPIILFAIKTGMRRGELLALKWDHIDRQRRSLVIPQTKNGFSRIIPLTKATLQILDTVPTINDRMFPITANGLRAAWNSVRRQAGAEDLHFHDLRHEAISRLFEEGLSVPEVALISGHRDARMLFRYTHALRGEIMKKLEAD
jgi:integrase